MSYIKRMIVATTLVMFSGFASADLWTGEQDITALYVNLSDSGIYLQLENQNTNPDNCQASNWYAINSVDVLY